MPTRKEREYYAKGFQDGARWFEENLPEAKFMTPQRGLSTVREPRGAVRRTGLATDYFTPKPKRKLSAWQKFVKANSKKPRFKYKSGKKKGMINLKALGVAYRKKRR